MPFYGVLRYACLFKCLPQPHPSPASVLGDELHAGLDQTPDAVSDNRSTIGRYTFRQAGQGSPLLTAAGCGGVGGNT